ncbi:hypothetical protein N8T08_002298 [Aspergillus melleus]|uniref:Uncharacterized protein n=1 Tax=Aspergillus melleus TaxID=138277 RepID=A0ACC3B9E5_9EURO|nr:hypothetical protein N8T08_002298 [Aspergillus melleus]
MSTSRLPRIAALRKHQLLLEFSSLKHAAPPGTYVSIAPNDPTLWIGVIFVRSGPYASAVLRFQIRFPSSYPDLPPLVTFATDVFHPLIVPLTTYTFSTNASSEDPVSATDEERLPPGGFSLRHGFSHWFGRDKRNGTGSNASFGTGSIHGSTAEGETTDVVSKDGSVHENVDPSSKPQCEGEGDRATGEKVDTSSVSQQEDKVQSVPVSMLLDYIRTTFDDETVLDSLPLEAAGNPSAWHAWKAHRKDSGNSSLGYNAKRGSPQTRLPGDWHWDGIWAKRVQHEIEASHSESTLFGSAARGGTEDTIRFSRLDDATLTSVKNMIVPVVEETHE